MVDQGKFLTGSERVMETNASNGDRTMTRTVVRKMEMRSIQNGLEIRRILVAVERNVVEPVMYQHDRIVGRRVRKKSHGRVEESSGHDDCRGREEGVGGCCGGASLIATKTTVRSRMKTNIIARIFCVEALGSIYYQNTNMYIK
jgi:hypothetical protein